MAGIVGYNLPSPITGNTNPNLSTDLDDNIEIVFTNEIFDVQFHVPPSAYYSIERMPGANNWGIVGARLPSFKNDYYERVHILPTRIDLGTVANAVTRQVSVWNAYTEQSVTLDQILIQNGAGISVQGDTPPTVFLPLQEKFYDILITPNGPPEIDAEIQFDFSDADDPLPVVITGNRAVVLPAIPELPVKETWKWLTDVQVTYGGIEQRIGLREVPRRSLNTDLVFETEAEVREQYKVLLSALGRLFVPYFQWNATINQDALAGDTVLAFDTSRVDLRADDYVLLIEKNSSRLVQLETIGSVTATTKAALSSDVKKGTRVVAIYASLLPNNLTLSRPAVNKRATMALSSNAIYPRATHQRPGNTATLNSLDGIYILERRPLVDGEVEYEFDTGQETLDSNTGLFDVETNWDFTKVESAFQFKARRLGVDECSGLTGAQEMDYWRLFTDQMKGSLNNFLLCTFRTDQIPAETVGIGADSMVFVGPSYNDNFWPAVPYHYISIQTDAGVHYAKVTGSGKNGAGNSVISFTPGLPSSPGWSNVQYISYLLKQRIVDDVVELEHYTFDTVFNFRARTVKE